MTEQEARYEREPDYASVTINGRTETFGRGTLGYGLVMLSLRKHPEPDADMREAAEWRFPWAVNMLPGDAQDILRAAQVQAYVLGRLDERAKHPEPEWEPLREVRSPRIRRGG